MLLTLKSTYVTPLPTSLPWFLVSPIVKARKLTMAYKTLLGPAPPLFFWSTFYCSAGFTAVAQTWQAASILSGPSWKLLPLPRKLTALHLFQAFAQIALSHWSVPLTILFKIANSPYFGIPVPTALFFSTALFITWHKNTYLFTVFPTLWHNFLKGKKFLFYYCILTLYLQQCQTVTLIKKITEYKHKEIYICRHAWDYFTSNYTQHKYLLTTMWFSLVFSKPGWWSDSSSNVTKPQNSGPTLLNQHLGVILRNLLKALQVILMNC